MSHSDTFDTYAGAHLSVLLNFEIHRNSLRKLTLVTLRSNYEGHTALSAHLLKHKETAPAE